MKIYRIKVFDHTTTPPTQWDAFFKACNKYLEKHGNVRLFPAIVKLQSASPRFVDKPNAGGFYSIDKKWFTETYTRNAFGYDFCFVFFDRFKWLKPQKKNKSAGESVREVGGVSELTMYGSFQKQAKRPLRSDITESELIVRFLHEFSHGMFDHKIQKEDLTHEYHYNRKDLLAAFQLWGFFTADLSARERLHNRAVGCLGTDASPNDVAPDELGCAETVNAIHKREFGFEIGGGLSTALMYKALEVSPYFQRVDQPDKGDIALSPTGMGNGNLPNGHVGIVGDGVGEGRVIMSNDSFKGTFEANYTIKKWKDRYMVKGGYPLLFYRRLNK